MNQTDLPQGIQIGVRGLPGAEMASPPVLLGPVEDRMVQVSVRVPAAQAAQLTGRVVPIHFEVASRTARDSSLVSEASTFIVPR